MKKISTLVIIFFAVGAFTLLSSHLKSSGGSPGGKTGSPADGNTCTQCHGGTAIAQAGWITSDIPVSGYIPGQTYTLTATGTHTGVGLFGFELTAEDGGANKVGSFIATNAGENQVLGGGSSITHTSGGTSPSGNSKSWTFDWTAPASGTGDVTFYAAFNAANGNGNTSGDVIYTSELMVTESSSAGIDENSNSSIQLYPNPAIDLINITYSGKVTEAHIVNSRGQIVNQFQLEQGQKSVDISSLEAGVYFLRLAESKGMTRLMVK